MDDVKLRAAISALIGYTESLSAGTTITQEYIDRLHKHYIPNVKDSLASLVQAGTSRQNDPHKLHINDLPHGTTPEEAAAKTKEWMQKHTANQPQTVSVEELAKIIEEHTDSYYSNEDDGKHAAQAIAKAFPNGVKVEE